jgi:hypothetical protein
MGVETSLLWSLESQLVLLQSVENERSRSPFARFGAKRYPASVVLHYIAHRPAKDFMRLYLRKLASSVIMSGGRRKSLPFSNLHCPAIVYLKNYLKFAARNLGIHKRMSSRNTRAIVTQSLKHEQCDCVLPTPLEFESTELNSILADS